MITCPNCHSQELSGTLYCSQCGAQLAQVEGMPTQYIQGDLGQQTQNFVEQPGKKYTSPLISSTVSFHILDAGQILPLPGVRVFSIGRSVEGQPNPPDIDLTPYRAYEKGVSRLHASLDCQEKSVTITDLNSVNGTRVNGVKISPDKPFELNHGDILSFGKMKIQIIIRR